jgi:hypothetical protein
MKTAFRSAALALSLGLATTATTQAAPHGGGGGGHASGGHGGTVHASAVHASAVHASNVHSTAGHYAYYHDGHYHYGYYHDGHYHNGFAIGFYGPYAGFGYYGGGYGVSLSIPLSSGYSEAPVYYSAPAYYYTTPSQTYYLPGTPAMQLPEAPVPQSRNFNYDGDPMKPALKIPPAKTEELPVPVPKLPANPEIPKLGPMPGPELISLPTAKMLNFPAYGEVRTTRPADAQLTRVAK